MILKLYQYLMGFFEYLKPIGNKRAVYKVVRIKNILIYYIVSYLENILIKRVSLGALAETASNKSNNTTNEVYITASLTTFPTRTKDVRYAILSILFQTIRPDRIILWLAEEQYPNKTAPHDLQDLCKYGLEIRFCDDIRSHKKYFYALQQQKTNEVVITFDDDIIYHPHTIERLMKKHKEYPRCIVCSQVHILTFDKNGSLNPYHLWGTASDYQDKPNYCFTPLTGSGCLYPFGIMPKDTFDKVKIKDIAFTADDLWIAAIANVSGIKICPTKKVAHMFSVIGASQYESLSQINCVGNGNNSTLEKLQDVFHFPQYLDKC